MDSFPLLFKESYLTLVKEAHKTFLLNVLSFRRYFLMTKERRAQ